MAKKMYSRQVGIINIEDYTDNEVTIIGCGAVGSFVAISLAKMGLTKFKLFDFDKVEEHNLPNQFFSKNDIGNYKTEMTLKYLKMFNPEAVAIGFCEPFTSKTQITSQIVICCVDTMAARKAVFDACKTSGNPQILFDTRMSGLQAQLYTIDLTDKEATAYYESTLFSDEEAVQDRCTARAIIFTVMGVASLVCNNLVKALKEEEVPQFLTLDYITPQLI